MKQSASRFAGLLLLAALLVGAPLLSAKDRKDWDDDNGCKDKDRETSCSVPMPDSHGGPLLVLTGGVLGAALFVQRRRKATS
jgi:MYXO-CTERM domain-containing protein